jgi:membrane protein implicated in regulation of membrane protease activity
MESFFLAWWMWLVVGVVLLLAEMAAPGGFYLFFFGVGAMAVGLLAAADLAGPLWLQLLLFAGVSVLALLLFRQRLLQTFHKPGKEVDTMVGEAGVLLADLAAGDTGKIELRGTVWKARTSSGVALEKGQRCIVERVEGLLLWVRGQGE